MMMMSSPGSLLCVIAVSLLSLSTTAIPTAPPPQFPIGAPGEDNTTIVVAVDTRNPQAFLSESFASFSVDVKSLKNAIAFNNSWVMDFAKTLSPGVLRIGGTDQNSFWYELGNRERKSSDPNAMTGLYWDQVVDFAQEAGLDLVFGINPYNLSNVDELFNYVAERKQPVKAYTVGNEITGNSTVREWYADVVSKVRQSLNKAYSRVFHRNRPELWGPDTSVARWNEDTDEGMDYIQKQLPLVRGYLDAFTFHTYTFKPEDLGSEDHTPFNPDDPNAKKLWDPKELEITSVLAKNVSTIAGNVERSLPLYLSEGNSVCHQGLDGATNSFINSLWLTNHYGMLAQQGIPVVVRQTFVGYANYSLIYPEGGRGYNDTNVFYPWPDYFTTALFKTYVGQTVLNAGFPSTEASENLRTYAYCAKGFPHNVVVTSTNFGNTTLSLSLGEMSARLGAGETQYDFVATADDITSHEMKLNNHTLTTEQDGKFVAPDFESMKKSRPSSSPLVLPPHSFALTRFEIASRLCNQD